MYYFQYIYNLQLHHELENRSSSSELEERGYLHSSQSSVLAGRVVELERNFKKDTIHRELENRPNRDEMIERGMLSKLIILIILNRCSCFWCNGCKSTRIKS